MTIMPEGWERAAPLLALAVVVLLRAAERGLRAHRKRQKLIASALRAGMTLEEATWHWEQAKK